MMIKLRHYLIGIFLFFTTDSFSQDLFSSAIPKEKRISNFWRYCKNSFISDRDSVHAHHYFNGIIRAADSAGDMKLKAYAVYFKKCWKILFSEHYEDHFRPGDYESVVGIFADAQAWAVQEGHEDIALSCEHYIGQVYYRASHYGMAFEHLLKADDGFRRIGYGNVPNSSEYLYDLGLRFYQFEEYDKALANFLYAIRFPFIAERTELNTLNAIGLIYVKRNQSALAVSFFRSTIDKATVYRDPAWIGIGTGNLGNVFLSQKLYDSALYYHRINFMYNRDLHLGAPEDAAKSALSMATALLRKGFTDSAQYYLQEGKRIAGGHITDTSETLDFSRRILLVQIESLKSQENFKGAMLLMDSLMLVENKLRGKLDNKILSRAVEKIEAQSYADGLNLLNSQKQVEKMRLYILLASTLLVILITAIVFREKWLRKKRELQLTEKDRQILLVEKRMAEEGLKHAGELLNAYVETIREKTSLINGLESEVTYLKSNSKEMPVTEIISISRERLIESTILTESEWQKFRKMFEQVYPGYNTKLKDVYPELTPAEARLFYLTKLKLSSREMATMLGVSLQTVHKLRYRLKKKLNLDEETSFESLVHQLG